MDLKIIKFIRYFLTALMSVSNYLRRLNLTQKNHERQDNNIKKNNVFFGSNKNTFKKISKMKKLVLVDI